MPEIRALVPAIVLSVVAALGCTGDGNTGTGPDSSAHDNSANAYPRASLTISVQLTAIHPVTENDTVTLTARVVDSGGVELLSPLVQWEGGDFVRTTTAGYRTTFQPSGSAVSAKISSATIVSWLT